MFIFLTCVNMLYISMEVMLDNASLLLELVSLFAMLSLTTRSICWLLSGILSGKLCEILLFLSDCVSANYIDLVSRSIGMSGAFSFRSSFTFSIPVKMVCVLFLLNLKQIFLDNVFSIVMV